MPSPIDMNLNAMVSAKQKRAILKKFTESYYETGIDRVERMVEAAVLLALGKRRWESIPQDERTKKTFKAAAALMRSVADELEKGMITCRKNDITKMKKRVAIRIVKSPGDDKKILKMINEKLDNLRPF